MIPYSRPKRSDLYTLSKNKLPENRTLHSGTYLYSPHMAVLPSPPGGKTHTQTSVQSFGQGNKKIWIPSKQKYLEFDIKEPLQDLKLTAEVKIESDALWCSGKVRNYELMKRTKF